MKAIDVVHASARVLGILASGENLQSDQLKDGLSALSGLLAQWATSSLLVYKADEIVIPLTAGITEYTVYQPVPNLSDTAYLTTLDHKCKVTLIRDTNISIDCRNPIIYSQEPDRLKLVIDQPDSTALTIRVFSLPTDIQAEDDLELPAHYERALKFALAIEIAPEYQQDVPIIVQSQFAQAIRMLKRSNSTPIYANPDPALMQISYGYRRRNLFNE